VSQPAISSLATQLERVSARFLRTQAARPGTTVLRSKRTGSAASRSPQGQSTDTRPARRPGPFLLPRVFRARATQQGRELAKMPIMEAASGQLEFIARRRPCRNSKISRAPSRRLGRRRACGTKLCHKCQSAAVEHDTGWKPFAIDEGRAWFHPGVGFVVNLSSGPGTRFSGLGVGSRASADRATILHSATQSTSRYDGA
jgi:hypothetical protein